MQNTSRAVRGVCRACERMRASKLNTDGKKEDWHRQWAFIACHRADLSSLQIIHSPIKRHLHCWPILSCMGARVSWCCLQTHDQLATLCLVHAEKGLMKILPEVERLMSVTVTLSWQRHREWKVAIALSTILASMRGNRNAVELASEQYMSLPTLYSTMAVLSRRIFGIVSLPSCARCATLCCQKSNAASLG